MSPRTASVESMPRLMRFIAFTTSYCAAVVFDNWEAPAQMSTYVARLSGVADYIPGQFYQRELPCILNLLRANDSCPDCVLIDGYVYLDGTTRPGLGKYLYDALVGTSAVIGVAKTAFAGIGEEFQVLRGSSKRPLFVTSVGKDIEVAKARIGAMHGSNRIPTLLKRVDQLCRQADEA